VEAADASVQAAEDDRNAVLVSLLGEVGLEYVTYRSLQQRIALANRNVAAQQGTLDLTRRLFNAGLAPELDVQRAAAQVATTAATIPLLEQQAAQAMHVLGVLIGQPPMALQQELAAVGPIPKPPAQVAVGLPSELLLRRPDVARSERQLASQTAQIGVATRDLFPRFFITGAASLQSVHASDFFDWESRALSLGPSVSWPIFQGGRIRANVELQTATQQELLAAYQGIVLQAFQDVEDALVAFSHEQATRAQLEDAVRANERAADLARRLYAQGLTDFLTVLVAEQSVFTSQDSLAQTERDVALELVALYKAVGGGWEAAATAEDRSGTS
jgi:NodT family efflux transporter outer membrane factor (OMF) lipoprotein